MDFIKSRKDIEKNINIIDGYIKQIGTSYSEFAGNLIRKGRCFIAVQKLNSYAFYPSRFIGYLNNNMNSHQKNEAKDGRDTNPVISSILGQKLISSNELEKEYRNYCRKLKVTPYNNKRTFWIY